LKFQHRSVGSAYSPALFGLFEYNRICSLDMSYFEGAFPHSVLTMVLSFLM